MSQRSRYWNKAVMHISPCMSSIHFSSVRASNTVRLLDLLLGTSAKIRGAMSWTPLSSSHLSFQKSILDPLPTSVITATEMRPANSLLTWIGRFAPGLLGALRLSHGHLAFKAKGKSLRQLQKVDQIHVVISWLKALSTRKHDWRRCKRELSYVYDSNLE